MKIYRFLWLLLLAICVALACGLPISHHASIVRHVGVFGLFLWLGYGILRYVCWCRGTRIARPLLLAGLAGFALIAFIGWQTHTEVTIEDAQTITGAKTFTSLNQTLYLSTTSGVDYGTQINTLQTQFTNGGAIGIPCTGTALTYSTPITINTPIRLFGMSVGSAQNVLNTPTEACTLQFTGTGAVDPLTITTPVGGFMNGVTLDHFTLIGNLSATGSSTPGCIVLKGPAPSGQLTNISLEHLDIENCKGDGIAHADNGFIININQVLEKKANSNGLHAFVTGLAGIPSQVRVMQSWFLQNTTDGIRFDSGFSGSAEFFGITTSNNGNNGGTFTAGSIKWVGGDVESNSQIGLFFGGSLSIVDSPNCYANGSSCLWFASGANLNTVIGMNHDSAGAPDDLHIAAGAQDNVIINPISSLIIFDAGTRTSFQTANPGLSAYAQTVSGPIRFVEDPVTVLGALAGFDYFYGDSTAHCIKASYNNGAFSCITLESRGNTFAASQSITGGNAWYFGEGAAAAGAGAADGLWGDSTAHRLKVNNNNGGATTLAVFTDNLGVFAGGGTISPALINTSTNCSSNGTAANPSAVTCGSSASGAFSCATNASTGTCVVSTTAVTSTSNITVQQVGYIGGRLGVTCNTTSTLPAGPLVTAISNGVSFTVTLGTVTTNPACFEYVIVD